VDMLMSALVTPVNAVFDASLNRYIFECTAYCNVSYE
jgi:hypothetical protein